MSDQSRDMSAQLNFFIEQAEYLNPHEFKSWSIEHPDERDILRKLTQSGAKLITGPRGCGKTTLLLKAHNQMLYGDQETGLPIYVNFKSSLKLEPFYKSNIDAVYWFNQWLLLKIYQGLSHTLIALGLSIDSFFGMTKEQIDQYAGSLELGRVSEDLSRNVKLDIPSFEVVLEKVLLATRKTRCVLLLDDAAHAFSSEQQRDFFDFFRQIKSRIVSPKAAIYPGVTVYSSTFHVGHDAEEIDVWVKPYDSSYTDFMFQLLKQRLPSNVFTALQKDHELLKLISFASFGIPRSLLNIVRNFYKEDVGQPGEISVNFNIPQSLKTIKDVFDNTVGLFRSLKVKIPIYEQFIFTGESIYFQLIQLIKSYNSEKSVDRQSVTIAIQRPIPQELSKVLGFFQYSGLLLPRGEVSRGENGVFELYVMHYAGLIDRNALLGRKAPNVGELAEALEKRHPHEFTRVTPRVLLSAIDVVTAFKLALPPCQVCGTPRINEVAKFCLNCGSPLKTVSVFEQVVSRDISELPLTDRRVNRIKQNSAIRTIKDILIDHENRELRNVPQIGPYWSNRIYVYAEEFIA